MEAFMSNGQKYQETYTKSKIRVKVQNELQGVTDKFGNIQWQLKYRLVPKTQMK